MENQSTNSNCIWFVFFLQPIIMAFEKQIVGFFFFLFVFRGVECHMSQFQWRHLFFANHFFELDYGLDVPMVNRMGFFKNENKINLAEYISIEYKTVVDWNIKVHMSYDIKKNYSKLKQIFHCKANSHQNVDFCLDRIN